jgi:hypothetical protein
MHRRDRETYMSKTKNTANMAIGILILLVLGCSCSKLAELGKKEPPPPPSQPTTTSTPTASTKVDPDLSMAQYNQLQIGMARAEVERILGGKGTEISNSVGGGVRFSVNKWEGEKFKSIILSFKNDKIMSKSQVGLK